MVVHSVGKGAVVSEHSFDFRRMLELEFFVNVPTVPDRPPPVDTFVDSGTVGPQL